MSIKRAARFLAGYVICAVLVETIAWAHDGDDLSGVVMLGLSLPTTVAYFLGLLTIGKWKRLSPTSVSMPLAGFLSAFYPTFCGYFPVYFMRLKFAAPLIGAQFGLLLLISAIFSHSPKRLA
jgi:hypothetical protein